MMATTKMKREVVYDSEGLRAFAPLTPEPSFRSSFSPEAWTKAAHILEPLSEVALPAPTGWHVMIAQYVRPKKVGSLLMPDTVRDEDKYQGRCGIVLAVGPDAYKGDRYPTGPWCKVGDFVAWPKMENAASRMTYAGQVVTVITDDKVTMTGVDPEAVS